VSAPKDGTLYSSHVHRRFFSVQFPAHAVALSGYKQNLKGYKVIVTHGSSHTIRGASGLLLLLWVRNVNTCWWDIACQSIFPVTLFIPETEWKSFNKPFCLQPVSLISSLMNEYVNDTWNIVNKTVLNCVSEFGAWIFTITTTIIIIIIIIVIM